MISAGDALCYAVLRSWFAIWLQNGCLVAASKRTSRRATPFLVVLTFWLTIIFASFSLFTRPNATVAAALFIFALSAAGAIFLISELSRPFQGMMQISSAPLRNALVPLSP
jgi:hypothetical protein